MVWTFNGMGAQKNAPQKSFFNIFSMLFFVKTKLNSLRILQKQKSFQKTQICFPRDIKCLIFLVSQNHPQTNFKKTENVIPKKYLDARQYLQDNGTQEDIRIFKYIGHQKYQNVTNAWLPKMFVFLSKVIISIQRTFLSLRDVNKIKVLLFTLCHTCHQVLFFYLAQFLFEYSFFTKFFIS